MLTGLRPAVAQALVHLGLELSGIATLGDLQSGINYAHICAQQADHLRRLQKDARGLRIDRRHARDVDDRHAGWPPSHTLRDGIEHLQRALGVDGADEGINRMSSLGGE